MRPNDEVVSAVLVGERDDLLLVSKKAMSLRFTADDEALRPMGRSTSGVIGMKFRAGDELLAMDRVIENGKLDVFTATDGGYAKRTPVEEYRVQGRGGLGIKAAKIDEESRGTLVGALIVSEEDEVLAITSAGTVMRTPAAEVRRTGRDTMGVRLVNLTDETVVVSIARNAESEGGEVSEVSEVVE